MSRKIFTSAVLLWSVVVSAQDSITSVDSLRSILEQKLPDSTRSLVLAELAYAYKSVPDSNYAIARRGLNMAQKENFPHGVASNELSLAVFYYYTSDFVKALEYDLKALAFHQTRPISYELARCHAVLGVIYSLQDNIKASMSNMLLAMKYFEIVGDLDGQLLCLNNAGSDYTKIGKYDSAFAMLNQGLRLATKYRRKLTVIALTGSMAELYLDMGAPMRAEQYIRQSIALNAGLNMVLQAYNYNMLAKIQLRQNHLQLARQSVDKALEVEQASRPNDNEPETYSILSEIFLAQADYKRSLSTYKTSVTLERQLFSAQKQKEQLSLLHRFELDEKEHAIRILEQERALSRLNIQLKEQQVSEQKLYLVGFGFLLLVVCALLLMIQRQSQWRKQHIRRLQEKNQQIEETAKKLDDANHRLEEINTGLALHAKDVDSKIETYAFLNSHKIRGPVASMMGLIGLVEEGKIGHTEVDFVMTALKKEVNKLDKAVFEISKAIE